MTGPDIAAKMLEHLLTFGDSQHTGMQKFLLREANIFITSTSISGKWLVNYTAREPFSKDVPYPSFSAACHAIMAHCSSSIYAPLSPPNP